MPRFVVISNETGRVAKWGRVTESDMAAQAGAGQTVIEIPDDAPPITGNNVFDFNSRAFSQIVSDLEIMKRRHLDILDGQCAALITGGFQSEATGLWREYPSKATDQANMQQVAILGGLLMAKTGGEWGLVSHTAAQGVNVLADFRGHCDAARQLLADRRAAVMAAHTPEQIAEITLS